MVGRLISNADSGIWENFTRIGVRLKSKESRSSTHQCLHEMGYSCCITSIELLLNPSMLPGTIVEWSKDSFHMKVNVFNPSTRGFYSISCFCVLTSPVRD